ncbi:hypothetical protein [Litchfieldella xinjiangensis]|uniref:hypothetical protein n=1 Tax=Litchfieldella xinjiangensis TaxID=1166948 RepID=UPI0009DD67B5|nr:hypothetical protein [Halomonas xinjiangensis]
MATAGERKGRSWIVILPVLWVMAGCSEEPERPDATESEATATTVSESPSASQEDASSLSPMTDPVTIEARVEARPDERLKVTGQTNLPDGTEVMVMIERVASGVRWRHLTRVEAGRFSAEPFGPGSGVPDGEYAVSVSARPAHAQPEAVRDVIGAQGEHLQGELVSEARHRGRTATLRFDYTSGTS